MDLFETLTGRRSVWEFLPEEVLEEHLELILDVARHTCTEGILQLWKSLIVSERANKEGLREGVKEYLRMEIDELELAADEKQEKKERVLLFADKIFSVPILILVVVDVSAYPDLVGYEGATAAQNMMLAAYALWVTVQAGEVSYYAGFQPHKSKTPSHLLSQLRMHLCQSHAHGRRPASPSCRGPSQTLGCRKFLSSGSSLRKIFALGVGSSFQTTLFPKELVKERFQFRIAIGSSAPSRRSRRRRSPLSFIWEGSLELRAMSEQDAQVEEVSDGIPGT